MTSGRLDAPYVVVMDSYAINDHSYLNYTKKWLTDFGIHNETILYVGTHEDPYIESTDAMLRQGYEDLVKPIINQHKRKLIIGFGNHAMVSLGLSKKAAGITKAVKKMHTNEELNAPIVMSVAPYAIRRTPSQEPAVWEAMSYVITKMGDPDAEDVAQDALMTIIDITRPEQVEEMRVHAYMSGMAAFDFETTGLDCEHDYPVTLAICTGMDPEKPDHYLVWFYAPYNRLQPCFDDYTLEEFKKKFLFFFSRAGIDYRTGGWNIDFDDWIKERWLLGPPEERYDDPIMRTKLVKELPLTTIDGMLMYWAYNTTRPHGLKAFCAKHLGVPNYEAGLEERTKSIKARRGRNIKEPDDFMVADLFKVPLIKVQAKNGVVTYKWPTTTNHKKGLCEKPVDQMLCAYALVELESLRWYNCLDACYSYEGIMWLSERLEVENLVYSAELRHIAHARLFRAEQRGLLLDKPTNRKFSRQLEKIIFETHKTLIDRLWETPGLTPEFVENFNPNANAQVGDLLYGPTYMVPVIRRKDLYRKYEYESVEEVCNWIESQAYGDIANIKQLCREDIFDAEAVMQHMQEIYEDLTGNYDVLMYDGKLLGLGGLGYDPPVLTKTGKASASTPTLTTLLDQRPNEILDLVLMWRKAYKLKYDFVDKPYFGMDEYGLLHPHFGFTSVETGRISSSGAFNVKINYQNWTKYIRGQVKARKGFKFAGIDFKSAEIFTLAAFSNDVELLNAIKSEDIHRYVASIIFEKPQEEVTYEERQISKTSVFLILYGGGVDKLAMALGLTKARTQFIMDTLFIRFPGIKQHMLDMIELATAEPCYVYTAFGSRRSTRDILSTDGKVRSHWQRCAINSPIQGSAGELTLYKIDEIIATCELNLSIQIAVQKLGHGAVFIDITVHDSMEFEVHESLIWNVPGPPDKNGKPTEVAAGPFVDLVQEVVSRTVPFPPLDRVTFKVDIEVSKYWNGEPNLEKALMRKTDKFRFDLLPNLDLTKWEYAKEVDEDGNEIDAESDELPIEVG